MFDNAIADAEADSIVEWSRSIGFKPSLNTGKLNPDGTATVVKRTSSRTSTNAICSYECARDPTVQGVVTRIANITGTTRNTFEPFQMIRYEKGQYFRVHNDFIDYLKDRVQGTRVLTFYFYLNDVEAGGGTSFTNLNLTVTSDSFSKCNGPSDRQ
jgi:prolyl 4-hydroxylase